MDQFTAQRKKRPCCGELLFIGISIFLFSLLFTDVVKDRIDFWWGLSFVVLGMAVGAFFFHKPLRTEILEDISLSPGIKGKIVAGIVLAMVLYVFFWMGNSVIRLLVPLSGAPIDSVYALRNDISTLRVSILLLFIIGPGEELFWRGFLQTRVTARFGRMTGYLSVAVIYTAVHMASKNPMLISAALICGLFWGYVYMSRKSMVINIVSHALWDILVFIVAPLST